VRFIGEAPERIREDYLRILRFFRFFAAYDPAPRPDAQGLAAAIAEKAGLAQLSGERIRAELLLLLAAPRAVEAVRTMREAGLIEPLLGVAGDVDRLARLAAIETALGREPDALLRLAALALEPSSDAARLQERLRLSSAETARLSDAGVRHAAFSPATAEREAQGFIYRHGAQAFTDGALMAWAASGDGPEDEARAQRVRLTERWQAPELPLRGADVLALGVPPGPEVGRVIAAFEAWWVGADFTTDRERIKAKVGELVRG
jgi:poly(A) polymerase